LQAAARDPSFGLSSNFPDELRPEATAAAGDAVLLTLRLERGADGSFGLKLNDHNRINRLEEGSPAAKCGLKPFDRIVAVEGAPLTGKLVESCGRPRSLPPVKPAICSLQLASRSL